MRIVFILIVSLSLYAQERIITLTPAISEIIFALNKGDELVGVSEYFSFPKEVQSITKIASCQKY
ncbi:hypothetical protein JHD50_10075 [Sulfurimonas sp. MAG313]|nr:hypothetical protein [Sulfurimonas sp. MAG313]MDF1881645.1 hypothetical protein [Sulfurimonas sp. MAG313]